MTLKSRQIASKFCLEAKLMLPNPTFSIPRLYFFSVFVNNTHMEDRRERWKDVSERDRENDRKKESQLSRVEPEYSWHRFVLISKTES